MFCCAVYASGAPHVHRAVSVYYATLRASQSEIFVTLHDECDVTTYPTDLCLMRPGEVLAYSAGHASKRLHGARSSDQLDNINAGLDKWPLHPACGSCSSGINANCLDYARNSLLPWRSLVPSDTGHTVR